MKKTDELIKEVGREVVMLLLEKTRLMEILLMILQRYSLNFLQRKVYLHE